MKKNITITIERQYGSGGRTVGEMLANDLGIHYYNKELTKLAAEESGINEELFLKADESIRGKSPLRLAISKSVYKTGNLIQPGEDGFTSMENLFNYQAMVIQKLAESQPCVIVGRAANYILKDYDNVVSVFIHAPEDFLLEHAAEKQPMRGRELKKFIEETDEKKADYYRYYTGEYWDSVKNYDLCLNSAKLGYEKCVEEIKAYIRVRYGSDVLD